MLQLTLILAFLCAEISIKIISINWLKRTQTEQFSAKFNEIMYVQLTLFFAFTRVSVSNDTFTLVQF